MYDFRKQFIISSKFIKTEKKKKKISYISQLFDILKLGSESSKSNYISMHFEIKAFLFSFWFSVACMTPSNSYDISKAVNNFG